jgi:hypothetical protein
MHLPPELDFLSPFFTAPSREYQSAAWLLSDFNEDVWEYSFDFKETQQLDWNINLYDGTPLKDPKNENLLKGFKYFLTSSTRDNTGLVETNSLRGTQQIKFYCACRVIDYLLINGERYKIGEYGLEGLTGGNLIEILESIAASPFSTETIYNWSARLRAFCLDLLDQTDEEAIQETINSNPQLSIITQEQMDADSLDIPYKLIPRVRAALYIKDFYYTANYGMHPSTALLSKLIYPETLYGKNQIRSRHPILCFNNDCSQFHREHPAAPISSGEHERMNENTYSQYRAAVYSLGILHEIPLPAPSIDALKQAVNFTPNLATLGRFRTLPSETIFTALRKSIEFHLSHGRELTKAFCRVALECRKRKVSPCSLTTKEVQSLIGHKLRSFGVTTLSIGMRTPGDYAHKSNIKGQREEYFLKLRDNNGLYELLAVYTGAIQLTIGILMSRRASELYKLKADSCLDDTEQWLLFMNAKSTRNLFGIRQQEARPIEPIAVDMIKSLIRMQKVLVRIGYIPKLQTLFSLPDFRGASKFINSNATIFNRNLDYLCDYFETPFNSNGQRYYFRQHQMRRFFSMLFFYCGSFAKLDTLQWMMGHADPKHIYRYITESTDGAVLAGAKAHFAAERLRDGDDENFLELSQLLKERHGTDDFTILDVHDLEDQIQELMREGWIEIEPEFFTDHQGKKFKVVARLNRPPEAA